MPDFSGMQDRFSRLVEQYPDIHRSLKEEGKHDNATLFLPSLGRFRRYTDGAADSPQEILTLSLRYRHLLEYQDLQTIARNPKKAYPLFILRLSQRYQALYRKDPKEREATVCAILNLICDTRAERFTWYRNLEELVKHPRFRVACEMLESKNDEVRAVPIVIESDEPFAPVLQDLAQSIIQGIVVKRSRTSIDQGEWAVWSNADGQKRLKHDAVMARYIERLCEKERIETWGTVIPLAFLEDYNQSTYFLERAHGRLFASYRGDPQRMNVATTLVKALAELHYHAAWSRRGIDKQQQPLLQDHRIIEENDYEQEFEGICDSLGMPAPTQYYRPLLHIIRQDISVGRVFVHNTCHPKNILIQEGKNTIIFLDWELAGDGLAYDDLVRAFEGPVQFSEEERRTLIQSYLLRSFSLREHKNPIHTDDPIFQSFVNEGLLVYHLRRSTMHLWAAGFMHRREKPELAKQQVRKSFEALEQIQSEIRRGHTGTLGIQEQEVTRFTQSLADCLTHSVLQNRLQ